MWALVGGPSAAPLGCLSKAFPLWRRSLAHGPAWRIRQLVLAVPLALESHSWGHGTQRLNTKGALLREGR